MIVIVADRWDQAPGGGREHYARELVAHLRATGHGVVTIAPRDAIPSGASRVLALTPDARATHYQLHGGLLDAAFAGEREAMASALRRSLHGPALALNRRRQRLRDAEARMLAGSTALMAFSHADAERLVARGIERARVTVARPGIDLQRFHPPAPARAAAGRSMPGTVLLLFVAHNVVLKGLRTAVLGIGRARQRGLAVALHVVGRGSRVRGARLAAREGLSAVVSWEGEASQDRLAALYRRADALIHPTFYDPFPRVCVEALASGRPVLTTARCGTAEIVRHGCEGFVVDDPRDVDGFADAIAAIASPALVRLQAAAAALGRRFDAAVHFTAVAEWLRRSPAR